MCKPRQMKAPHAGVYATIVPEGVGEQSIFIEIIVREIKNTHLFITCASNGRSAGMLGRRSQQNCDPSEAFIMATTEDLRAWMEEDSHISSR